MRAAVLVSTGQIEQQELEPPERLGPNSVTIEVGAVGVCGSDILRFGVGKGYGFPLVLGHEISGIVKQNSPSGKFTVGDRVAIFPCLPKSEDPLTRVGEWALSKNYDYLGSRRNGGMQEYLEVPEENLVRLPENMSLLFGAMVEPAAVSLHAIRKLSIPANAVALVIGAGPIGNLAAQWLRYRGVSKVVVADIDSKKRKIAESLGFQTIAAEERPTPEQIIHLTGGRGADICIEASGSPFTLVQAIDSAAAQGQVVLLGDLSGDLHLTKEQVSSVLRRELTLYGTWNSKIQPDFSSEWDMVVNAIGKGIDFDCMISHVSDLEQAQPMFEKFYGRKTWFNKAMFAISETAKSERDLILKTSLAAQLVSQS